MRIDCTKFVLIRGRARKRNKKILNFYYGRKIFFFVIRKTLREGS